MTKLCSFRLEEWFLEFLDNFSTKHHCKNRTKALYLLAKKYQDLAEPNSISKLPSNDACMNSFAVGTKIKCPSRKEYFELKELPCAKEKVFCTNEECFKRVQKLIEQSRKKPKEIQ